MRAVREGEVVTRERYNRVLASYAAAGRPAEAVDTMKQMVNEGGVTPDAISYAAIVQAHVNGGSVDGARAALGRVPGRRANHAEKRPVTLVGDAALLFGDSIKRLDQYRGKRVGGFVCRA